MANTIAKTVFLLSFLTAGLRAENLNPQFLDLRSMPPKPDNSLIFIPGAAGRYGDEKNKILVGEIEGKIGYFSAYPSFAIPRAIVLMEGRSTAPKEAEPGKPALPAGVPYYRLQLVTAPKGISGTKAKEGEETAIPAVQVQKIEREVSKTLATAIQRVWFRAYSTPAIRSGQAADLMERPIFFL